MLKYFDYYEFNFLVVSGLGTTISKRDDINN